MREEKRKELRKNIRNSFRGRTQYSLECLSFVLKKKKKTILLRQTSGPRQGDESVSA